MRIVSLAEVKAKLSAYVDEAVATGPVVITRNGKAIAVLVAPTDDEDLERLLLSRSLKFQTMLSDARTSIKSGRGIPHEEFWSAGGASRVREPSTHPRRRAVRKK